MKKLSRFNPNSRYKDSPYEKSTFVHLGRKGCKSPVQKKAKAVIRKYKMQLRQMEFKRLKQIVPSVQNDENSNEVSVIRKRILFLFMAVLRPLSKNKKFWRAIEIPR